LADARSGHLPGPTPPSRPPPRRGRRGGGGRTTTTAVDSAAIADVALVDSGLLPRASARGGGREGDADPCRCSIGPSPRTDAPLPTSPTPRTARGRRPEEAGLRSSARLTTV